MLRFVLHVFFLFKLSGYNRSYRDLREEFYVSGECSGISTACIQLFNYGDAIYVSRITERVFWIEMRCQQKLRPRCKDFEALDENKFWGSGVFLNPLSLLGVNACIIGDMCFSWKLRFCSCGFFDSSDVAETGVKNLIDATGLGSFVIQCVHLYSLSMISWRNSSWIFGNGLLNASTKYFVP